MTDQDDGPKPRVGDTLDYKTAWSERRGGVYLKDIAVGTFLRIRTADHTAILAKWSEDDYSIWGHPLFYPKPIPIRVKGSMWGGFGIALKDHFIGIGMRLVFTRLDRPLDIRPVGDGEYMADFNGITTAEILGIEELETTTA